MHVAVNVTIYDIPTHVSETKSAYTNQEILPQNLNIKNVPEIFLLLRFFHT